MQPRSHDRLDADASASERRTPSSRIAWATRIVRIRHGEATATRVARGCHAGRGIDAGVGARPGAFSRPGTLRIIVPFPAGATTDMLARLFAQRMIGDAWARRVVVENVGGAGGSLGADQVAKARARRLHAARSTTSPSPPRHRRCSMPARLAVTTSSRISCRSRSEPTCRSCSLAHPSVPAQAICKEFVDYAKQTATTAVLRLDRARQHHESDGRGAQARHRHQDAIMCRSAAPRRWSELWTNAVRRRHVEFARRSASRARCNACRDEPVRCKRAGRAQPLGCAAGDGERTGSIARHVRRDRRTLRRHATTASSRPSRRRGSSTCRSIAMQRCCSDRSDDRAAQLAGAAAAT